MDCLHSKCYILPLNHNSTNWCLKYDYHLSYYIIIFLLKIENSSQNRSIPVQNILSIFGSGLDHGPFGTSSTPEKVQPTLNPNPFSSLFYCKRLLKWSYHPASLLGFQGTQQPSSSSSHQNLHSWFSMDRTDVFRVLFMSMIPLFI